LCSPNCWQFFVFINFGTKFSKLTLGSIKPIVKIDVLYKILKELGKECGFKIEQTPDRLRLKNGNELLFFTPSRDEILFQCTHILDERKGVIVSLIRKFLSRAEKLTAKKFEFSEPVYYELMPELQSPEWVLDTCVVCLYENVKSILDFVIPNPFFYQSSFIIPEAVLYEINRKKEEKPSLCVKGINNLELLKILANEEFFELTFPKSEPIFLTSQGQVIRESRENIKSRLPSALVDFIILRHVDEKSTFVTKDKALEILAGIMGKRALNAEDYIAPNYQDIEIYERHREEFKERIYQRIDSQEKTTLDDLVGTVEEFLKKRETREEEYIEKRGDGERKKKAERIINRMVREGYLIEIPVKDGLTWEKSSIQEVVLDYDMVEEIPLYLKKENGDLYFKSNFLEKVRERSGLAKDVIPTLEVTLPKALITYAYHTYKNKIIEGIEILRKVKNARFEWIEIAQIMELSESLLKEILFRVCEEGNRILISKDKEIRRIARLRDIKCVKL